jgi:hypothetical protein
MLTVFVSGKATPAVARDRSVKLKKRRTFGLENTIVTILSSEVRGNLIISLIARSQFKGRCWTCNMRDDLFENRNCQTDPSWRNKCRLLQPCFVNLYIGVAQGIIQTIG